MLLISDEVMTKKKITALISDDVDEDLREHIQQLYKRPYGKLSEVIEESLKQYLIKQKQETPSINDS